MRPTSCGAGAPKAWPTSTRAIPTEEERTFFSDSEIDNIKNAHSVDSLEPPERFNITMASLARMIRRIAETRSNGSLVQGTDQTVGMSVQSLQDRGWRAEAALLHWMMYGEGERTGADSVTGLYTPEECIRHSARAAVNDTPVFARLDLLPRKTFLQYAGKKAGPPHVRRLVAKAEQRGLVIEDDNRQDDDDDDDECDGGMAAMAAADGSASASAPLPTPRGSRRSSRAGGNQLRLYTRTWIKMVFAHQSSKYGIGLWTRFTVSTGNILEIYWRILRRLDPRRARSPSPQSKYRNTLLARH
eukprot:750731-Prymnesium_polylepis.1